MTATLWWLVQNSIAVAALIAVVWVACRLLPNRPALQHTLWLVVLIKFVTPPIVSWPWSVSDVGDRIAQFVTPIENEIKSSPPDISRSEHKSRFNNGSPVAAVPAVSDRTAKPVEAVTRADSTIGAATRLAPRLLLGLWLAGCVIALAVQLRRIVRYGAVVQRGRPAPPALVKEITGVAGRLGLRPVPAMVVPQIATPFVWCLGWLRLIWPEALSSDTDVVRCRGIIAHELAHVKRRDHWVAWLELIATCLWWWNPLFWYVRRQLRETADLACDAQALSVVPGADRRAYAETFLELSRLVSQSQTPAPALGVSTGARRTIERRLSMILNERVKARTSAASLLFVAVLAIVSLPVWSLAESPKETSKKVEEASAKTSFAGSVGGDLDNDGLIGIVLHPARDVAEVEKALEQLRHDVAVREAELVKAREKMHALASALEELRKQQAQARAAAGPMKELRYDFRDQPLDPKVWTIKGPAGHVHSEKEGLRIALPAERTTVTLASSFLMEGDFDVTVNLQILGLGQIEAGDGHGVYLSIPSPEKEEVPYLARKLGGEGRHQFLAGFMKAGTNDWSLLFTNSKLSTMRLTRTGNVVRYYAGGRPETSFRKLQPGDDLRLMREVTLERVGARAVNLAVSNSMSPVEADVRLLDLTIRAEAILEIGERK